MNIAMTRGTTPVDLIMSQRSAAAPATDREQDTEQQTSKKKNIPHWWQYLFGDYQRPEDDPRKRDDVFWTVILAFLWVGMVAWVTATTIKNWPAETDMYPSNNAVPETGYTCACSLPLNLEDPKNPTNPLTEAINNTLNFNQCYPRSSLESISVLQYTTNYTDIDAVVQQYATTPVRYRESPGYVVSQDAHELTIAVGKDHSLKNLYRNDEIGFADEDILYSVGFVLGNEFTAFPESFVRMSFQYSCDNCSLCGLEHIKEIINNNTRGREDWISCYYYKRVDKDQCNSTSPEDNPSTYEGKCVLYPTRTVPFVFAIKTFLHAVNNTAGIRDIQPAVATAGAGVSVVSVQSNVVYLNVSKVTQDTMQHGFVESPKGSILRAVMVSHLPASNTECSKSPDVRSYESVCNGSSICNSFVNAGQSIQLKCRDMRNGSACEEIVKADILSLDNQYLMPNGVTAAAICFSPPFSCVTNLSDGLPVPDYKVIRHAGSKTKDPISSYLKYGTLYNDWLLDAGTCTNTYNFVYRFNDTMFFQAECTNGTDLCKLTGRYHMINDFFNEERHLDSQHFYNNSDAGGLFVCFQVRRQRWDLWLIDYVNTLFSWLGVLTFLYIAGLYKLVRFIRIRYSSERTTPNGTITSDSPNPAGVEARADQSTISSYCPRKKEHHQATPREVGRFVRLSSKLTPRHHPILTIPKADESMNEELRLFTAHSSS